MLRLRECANPATLAVALAQHVARRLKEDLLHQDKATLVVSGGKSPVPLFQALAIQPLAWDRVIVTLADERWVPPEHADSNEALVRTHLLTHRAATALMVPLWTGDPTPEAAVSAVSEALEALPHPFSQVLLGMGEDGHIASLFPGAAELPEGLRTEAQVLAVRPSHASHPRLSLSLHALMQSRDIVLLMAGGTKRRLLEQALEEGPVEALPVRAILRQTTVPVSIFWAP